MRADNWTVKREDDDCVCIHIDEDVDITGLELSLVNDLRQKILTMPVEDHDIKFCSNLHRPTYVQLGSSMKYVAGSGREYYSKN